MCARSIYDVLKTCTVTYLQGKLEIFGVFTKSEKD
jgi:hypothetical protein